jgi:hypothetical protein
MTPSQRRREFIKEAGVPKSALVSSVITTILFVAFTSDYTYLQNAFSLSREVIVTAVFFCIYFPGLIIICRLREAQASR